MQFSPRRPVFVSMAFLAACSVATAFAAPPPAQQPLATDKDKTSYAIGMQIGINITKSLQPVRGEVDINVVMRAVGTVINGGKPQMTVPEAQAQLESFGKRMQAKQQAQAQAIAQKNGGEGSAFFAANAKKPGVKTTASGLQYMVEKQGAGPKPKATDSVKVNYTGQLLDGTVFDSSSKHGGPAVMRIDQVIPGWTEGLQLMGVGSKYVFWIPGKLAYGENGMPGSPIGPNATLKFEVELLSIGNK